LAGGFKNEVWLWDLAHNEDYIGWQVGDAPAMPATLEAWGDGLGTVTIDIYGPVTNAYPLATTQDLDALRSVSVTLAGGFRNPSYWYLDYEDVFRTFSGVSGVSTNNDVITTNYSPSATYVDKRVFPRVVRGFPPGGEIAWQVVPSELATIDQQGFLTMLEAGSAEVSATVVAIIGDDETKSIDVPLYIADPGETISVSHFAPGSLRAVASDYVDGLIAAGTATLSRAVWNVTNHVAGIYELSTNCWAADVDLSGVVVRSGTSGASARWHGTLVTSQHIACAKHVYDPVGSVKRFVGRTGAVYDRTITHIRDPWPGQTWGNGRDITFARLNEPLPLNDVAVYPVLPALYTNYTPNGFLGCPALIYDQLLRASVCELGTAHNTHRSPLDATRLAFYSTPYTGDSGRPTFLVLPDKTPILLSLFTFAQSGTSFSDNLATLNAALAVDGATLTEVDLSDFEEYTP
jgi:hypothetical protein